MRVHPTKRLDLHDDHMLRTGNRGRINKRLYVKLDGAAPPKGA